MTTPPSEIRSAVVHAPVHSVQHRILYRSGGYETCVAQDVLMSACYFPQCSALHESVSARDCMSQKQNLSGSASLMCS